MSEIVRHDPPVKSTADPIDAERLAADVARVLETLHGGGVAIVPLDVAYAVVGHRERAIRAIFTAKDRSYEKPSGMFADWRMSEEIHVLPDSKRRMIRTMVEEEKLPFSVVAPFERDHPFFSDVDPFVLANSTKTNTIDMLLNAGAVHDEIARQAWEARKPVFGSSANTSLKGSKYRYEDIEPAVRDVADIALDYGLSRYANEEGRSSTIIDFSNFEVIRIGVVFDRVKAAFRERFDVELITSS